MQSPPFPRYLVPPRSKYSPQHHVLKHPQLPFLPQCQRPSFTPIQNSRQNYSSWSLNFWIATWKTKDSAPSTTKFIRLATYSHARFWVLMSVTMKIRVCWDVMAHIHGLGHTYHRFRTEVLTYSPTLQNTSTIMANCLSDSTTVIFIFSLFLHHSDAA